MRCVAKYIVTHPAAVCQHSVAPEAVWPNLKFGMAAPYQYAETWVVDSQENH